MDNVIDYHDTVTSAGGLTGVVITKMGSRLVILLPDSRRITRQESTVVLKAKYQPATTIADPFKGF